MGIDTEVEDGFHPTHVMVWEGKRLKFKARHLIGSILSTDIELFE